MSREGYFETYEVSVLLDYLKILDYARQDLPLAAVLTSVLGGLDTRELAEIRIAYPNVPFYNAAAMCAKGDAAEDACMEELRGKLRRFYDQVRYF